MIVKYTRHHFEHPEGHIFLGKPGACTITLQGASAMPQDELDEYGQIMAEALGKAMTARLLKKLKAGETLKFGVAKFWKKGKNLAVQVFEEVPPDEYPLSAAGLGRALDAVR